MANVDEDKLIKTLSQKLYGSSVSAVSRMKAELNKQTKRKNDLETLFMKMYEDKVFGRLPEEQYDTMTAKYHTEIEELTSRIADTKKALFQAERDAVNDGDVYELVDRLKKISMPTTLTAEMVEALIQKIVVHQAIDIGNGDKTQDVEIFWKFVGDLNDRKTKLDATVSCV